MLYVMRHDETDYNVVRRIYGHAEARLTEKGYQRAESVAEEVTKQGIQIDHLLASPLKRAQETARKIAKRSRLMIETKLRLVEINLSIYGSEPIETTTFQKNRSEISLPFPEGESILDAAGRIHPLIEEALAPEETYLFVCHDAVIRVIDNYLSGKKIQDFLDFHCEDTQLIQYGE